MAFSKRHRSEKTYRHVPLALQVISPVLSQEDPDQSQTLSLEAAMQSLVLDDRYPVALELAGTASRRSFLVRATTQVALDHIEEQLRTLYPQLEVRPLRTQEDPFHLAEHEAVSAVELTAGGAEYIPLRTWQEEDQQARSHPDPILSLLAALGKLPPDIRAIAQIGLVPARPDWSKRHFFSLKMLPPSAGDPVLAESIRARCRVRYTRRVVEIDEMLQAAMIQNVRLISMENREGKRPGETAEPEQLPVVETSTLVPPLAAPPVSEGATPHAVERITPAREPARSKQTMTTLLRTESERAGKMQVMAERDDELPQGSMRSKRSWGPWQPQQNMGGGEMSPHVSPTSLRQ